ncbi:LysM peptidoglycan-binding domain-containing protein [Enterococcus sp. DIV1420a]|uniref:LysM peptidoglycan-binding domain-containing protein n=1 Tax=Enterococcus sp. DIV1420a TaxID=2774672 RepID=UPI003F21EF50
MKNKIKNNNRFKYEERKYRVKMYKKGKLWLIKGALFSSLMLIGSFYSKIESVYADEWSANSIESINARLGAAQSIYIFEDGDTFYNISLAINVKWQKLMELNGFKIGSQYTVPIGTNIRFNGLKVTLTSPQGEIINEIELTPADKIYMNQPFGQQVSDDTSSSNKKDVVDKNYQWADNQMAVIQKELAQKDKMMTENMNIDMATLVNKKNDLAATKKAYEALDEKKTEIGQAKKEVEEHLRDMEILNDEKKLRLLKGQKIELTQKKDTLTNDLNEQINRLSTIESELIQQQKEEANLNYQLVLARSIYQSARQKIADLTNEKEDIENKLNPIEENDEQQQELRTRLITVKGAISEISNVGNQLAEIQERVMETGNYINQLTNEKELRNSQIDGLQVELGRLQAQIDSLDQSTFEREIDRQDLIENQKQLESYNQFLNELDYQMSELATKIKNLVADIEELEKSILNGKASFNNIKAQFLTDSQIAAKTAIQELTNLNSNEKLDFFKQVDQASTNEEVFYTYVMSIYREIQNIDYKLTLAKEEASKIINSLTSLNEDEKNRFTKKVSDSESIEEVTQVKSAAIDEDNESQTSLKLNLSQKTIAEMLSTWNNLSLSERMQLMNR